VVGIVAIDPPPTRHASLPRDGGLGKKKRHLLGCLENRSASRVLLLHFTTPPASASQASFAGHLFIGAVISWGLLRFNAVY
jgi:hypothetical protein